MEVWILVEYMNQSDYTEPRYFCAAADACEIKGVYGSALRAQEEKERLEALPKQDQDDLDADPCYYVVLPYTVE